MKRIFTFFLQGGADNNTEMIPAYYISEDYATSAVRVRVKNAPTSDAKIDIFADGVSIFNNNKQTIVDGTTGSISIVNDHTYIGFPAGSNTDEMAEDFNSTPISQESWLTCQIVETGGGKDFTVQLELEPLSEDGEGED